MDKYSVEYYMNLPYRVEIVELTPEDGGGVVLCLPELGRAVMTGYGNSYEEAKASLAEVKADVFEHWLKNGVDIPLPENIQRYSGKVSLRMPPELHKVVAHMAKRGGKSINQFIVDALEVQVEMLVSSPVPGHEQRVPQSHLSFAWCQPHRPMPKDYSLMEGASWIPMPTAA